MRISNILLFFFIITFTTSCSYNSLRPDIVDRNQAQRMQTVKYGTIEAVDKIVISGDQEIGALAGAAIGAISGSGISDNGPESAIGGVLGSIVGSAIGSSIGEAATRKDAVELLITLDDGKVISIIQESSNRVYVVGSRVKVITSAGKTRVLPL
jgi:outer membrane lipoprotein SlyB